MATSLPYGPNRYKVEIPGRYDPQWKCQPLNEVSHVAHVPTALRIIEDQLIKADLVFDESKLNTQRIRVVWLSPNDWTNADGFRYGNVRFTFDWASIINGKHCYWVEAMDYSPEACRILVTEKEHPSLARYDPSDKNGPWWHDTTKDRHFWNGKFTLEIMLECDLPIVNLRRLDFVKHHPNYCCIDPGSCPDRGRESHSAASKFIIGLVANNKRVRAEWLNKEDGNEHGEIREGWETISKKLMSVSCSGSCGSSDTALARAVLAAMHNRSDSDVEDLARLFVSADQCREACRTVALEVLGFSANDLL